MCNFIRQENKPGLISPAPHTHIEIKLSVIFGNKIRLKYMHIFLNGKIMRQVPQGVNTRTHKREKKMKCILRTVPWSLKYYSRAEEGEAYQNNVR